MLNNREIQRTIAQFLNAVAAAVLAAGAIGPLHSGSPQWPAVALAIAMGLGLHVLALMVTWWPRL